MGNLIVEDCKNSKNREIKIYKEVTKCRKNFGEKGFENSGRERRAASLDKKYDEGVSDIQFFPEELKKFKNGFPAKNNGY